MNVNNRVKRKFGRLWAGLGVGLCPGVLEGVLEGALTGCVWWGVDPVEDMWLRGGYRGDSRGGCRLADGRGAICTRDPNFRGSGGLESGHAAGFDFFWGTWCEAARERLPTRETREFWFPPEYNAKQWRTRRYHARARGRARAARRRRGLIRGPVA